MENITDLSVNFTTTSMEQLNATLNTTVIKEQFYVSLDWVDYTELTLLGLIVLIAAPGNGLIILVQMKTKDKISTDIIVAAIAVFDLLDSVVNVPFNVMTAALKEKSNSLLFCKFSAFCAFWTALSSSAFIGILAVDRYFLTCLPHFTKYNKTIARNVCFVTPFITAFISSPYFFFISYEEVTRKCYPSNPSFIEKFNPVLILIILLDFVVITVLYAKIAIMLRKRNMKRQKGCQFNSIAITNTAIEESSHTTVLSSGNTNSISIEDIGNENLPEENLGKGEFPSHKITGGIFKEKDMENVIPHSKSVTKTVNDSSNKTSERSLKKITILVFLISVTYMLSWTFGSVVIITGNYVGRVLSQLLYLGRRANIVTNPILFICMSTKFRATAKKIICGRCYK